MACHVSIPEFPGVVGAVDVIPYTLADYMETARSIAGVDPKHFQYGRKFCRDQIKVNRSGELLLCKIIVTRGVNARRLSLVPISPQQRLSDRFRRRLFIHPLLGQVHISERRDSSP